MPVADLPVEIERKYLVVAPPEDLSGQSSEAIRQGYLDREAGGTSIRLRQRGEAYVLTVKQGSGLRRAEVEVTLGKAQFDALWPLTEGRRLSKTRYYLAHGAHTIECDVFHERLEGLVLAEVEFDSEQAAEAFQPPSWFGRDVTGEDAYGNHALAVQGLPAGAGEQETENGSRGTEGGG